MFTSSQRRPGATLFMLVLLLPLAASAGDWPQLLGPLRNGEARDETLPDQLPDNLNATLSYPLGAGFAGPAIAGDRIVVFHRTGDKERVEALDVRTGTPQWHADFPAEYEGGYNPDSGPRCVPLIDGDDVFVFGASGRLHALDFATGQPRWSRSLAKDYGAPDGYFGAGSTPLLAGDHIIVSLGGRNAGIVGVDRNSGKTVWQATDEQVSYASPTSATLNGKTHWLVPTRLNLLSVQPKNGAIVFSHPFGKRGLTVTGTTPLVFDNHIFLSASYNIGAELVRVTPTGQLETVWANDDALSSQYTNSVYHKGFLYGTHGREDGPMAELRCIEALTGQVRWRHPNCGVAHVILAGDRLLIVEVQTGNIAIVNANPDRYDELDRRQISSDTLRALPALANGMLYVRTSRADRGGQLLVFPLR